MLFSLDVGLSPLAFALAKRTGVDAVFRDPQPSASGATSCQAPKGKADPQAAHPSRHGWTNLNWCEGNC